MSADMLDRVEYVAGLRALADLLEAHEIVPLPGAGRWSGSLSLSLVFLGEDAKDRLAEARRVIGGKFTKHVDPDGEYSYLRLRGTVGGLHVELVAERDAVCRRVVTGVREVTREIPAPDAPRVTVTETVEDVEWVCEPILDGEPLVEAVSS